MPRLLQIALLTLAPVAAAGAPDYRVEISEDFSSAHVQIDGLGASTGLRAYTSNAGRNSRDFRTCDGREITKVSSQRVSTQGASCIRYEVTLTSDSSLSRGRAGAGYKITRINDWLWFPTRQRSGMRVRFQTPVGAGVSVPWQFDGESAAYRIPVSPRSGTAHALFGRIHREDVRVAGAVLRLAFIEVPDAKRREKLSRWLHGAASNVATSYGRFPHPAPQVLLFGIRSSGGSPVPYGTVVRNQGESVRFLVDATRSLDSLEKDWTATHEFAHLLLPYIDDRWISEGFASYLQNVLLARGGVYDEAYAWQRLLAGFDRGRRSAPGATPAEASRSRNGTMKMYWAGAAIALSADVEIRRQTAGRQSLLSVLEDLASCCLPATRSYRAEELMRRLDAGLERPVFLPMYRRYANSPGFPDVATALTTLGIRNSGSQLRLSSAAASSKLRAEIMGSKKSRSESP